MIPLDYVVWRLPLRQAFCLYADACARYGVEQKGPTFVERAMVKAMRAAEEK